MTTAQLRNAADDAAKKLDWATAAALQEQAIAIYPLRGAMAELDKAKMEQKLRGWRAML